MSYYWAKFEKRDNYYFRFDTRIYLNEISIPTDNDVCIGAIVGKNPGSAMPSCENSNALQKIVLDGDKLLPNVRCILLKSYQHSNKQINRNSYIQVLNLIYVCDKNLSQAINKIKGYHDKIICDTESKYFPFLWYVWGADNKNLNVYKKRFSYLNVGLHFYLDNITKEIINRVPDLKDSARHTQGLKHEFVVPYISKII